MIYYVTFPNEFLSSITQSELVTWNHLATHRVSGDFLLIASSVETDDFKKYCVLKNSVKEFVSVMNDLPTDYSSHWLQVFEPTMLVNEIQSNFVESSDNFFAG